MAYLLHISHLLELGKCGVKYEYKYIQGRREPGRIAPLVGTVTHAAARFSLTRKIETGGLPTEEEVSDLARDDFNARWENEDIELTEEERGIGKAVAKGNNLDLAVQLSGLHLRELAPTIQPLAVEARWVLETPYGVDLAGTTDVREERLGQDMLKDEEPRPFRVIRDLKTRGKRTTQLEVDTSIQLSIYALAEQVTTGVPTDLVALDTLIKPTQKRPAFVSSLQAERTEDDYRVLAARLERGVQVLQSGAFMPANQDEWYCSTKFCGFALDGTCPFFRGRTTHAVGGLDGDE